ncbi:MAG: hypothetical protein ACFFCP_11100 [Promethearchaeota archaeon]
MIGATSPDQKVVETKRVLHPGFIIVLFPVICSFLAVLFLTPLPGLIGAYNYLRGMSSPIDQVILALLGSDLSRIVVLASCIIGAIMGLYLSRFVTKKLDALKEDGQAKLSVRLYIVLFSWWILIQWPFLIISLVERIFYGFPMSHFLSDLGFFLTAGYFLAYSIPVLSKYFILVRFMESIDSHLILVEIRTGSGFIKRLQNLTLRVIHEEPDPGWSYLHAKEL